MLHGLTKLLPHGEAFTSATAKAALHVAYQYLSVAYKGLQANQAW